MRRFSLRVFGLILFFTLLVGALIYNFLVYKNEHNKALHIRKENVLAELNNLNYTLSIFVERNGIESSKDLVDSLALLNPFIASVSISDNERILLSSKREYIQRGIGSFNLIPYKEFTKFDNFEFRKMIQMDLKIFSQSEEKHYFILVELDQGYIYKYLDASIIEYIFYSIVGSLAMIFIIFYFLISFVFKPIMMINKKIDQNRFEFSHFSFNEIESLDQKLVENFIKIKSSNILLDSIINATKDLVFYKDNQFKYIGCNEAFLKFVGKEKHEMLGHNDFELFDKEMAELFREMDIKMLKENVIRTNFEWVTYPDGKKVYLQTQKIPFHYNEESIGILGVSRDITELHLAEETLIAQSFIDELTQLQNRKAYNQRIKEEISLHVRYKTKFSMLMYDIDDFKKINDTFGHDIGDKVLSEMSTLIKSLIRENDYIFRIGGEEFVIIFAATGLEHAIVVCEKIRAAVAEMETIKDRKITISGGLCEVIKDDTEDTIFKRCDELLYCAKKAGKNKIMAE